MRSSCYPSPAGLRRKWQVKCCGELTGAVLLPSNPMQCLRGEYIHPKAPSLLYWSLSVHLHLSVSLIVCALLTLCTVLSLIVSIYGKIRLFPLSGGYGLKYINGVNRMGHLNWKEYLPNLFWFHNQQQRGNTNYYCCLFLWWNQKEIRVLTLSARTHFYNEIAAIELIFPFCLWKLPLCSGVWVSIFFCSNWMTIESQLH